MSARDLLLEVLVEPLPPAYVPEAEARLKKAASDLFARDGVACTGLEAYGTARRLVLHAQGVTQSRAAAALFPVILAGLAQPGGEASCSGLPGPVRGLLALHGDRQVSFSFAGLRSGRVTEGHESRGPRRLTVASAEKYFKALEHAGVLVRDAERLDSLRAQLAGAGKRMKLNIEADEELLRENIYISEYPVCVVAGFSQACLKAEPETVSAAFRRLAFFRVSDQAGRLQPYFAGVRDGVSKGQRFVEEGFRRALEAEVSGGRSAARAGGK